MTGVVPVRGAVVYAPHYDSGRYDYADPSDPSLIVLGDGGLFEFDECVELVEVRADLAPATPVPPTIDGTFELHIEDRDGTHITTIIPALTNGVEKRFEYHPAPIILKSQRVRVVTTRTGSIELYVRKGDTN
jgi:hypothetical protein